MSNEAVKIACGMKKDAYDTAVSILIEEQYLVRKDGNTYDFYQFPNNVEPPDEEEGRGGSRPCTCSRARALGWGEAFDGDSWSAEGAQVKKIEHV